MFLFDFPNEGYAAPIFLVLPFLVAFAGVILMAYWVLSGDSKNRVGESELAGAGGTETPPHEVTVEDAPHHREENGPTEQAPPPA